MRPFNKWLRWELEHHPLDQPWRETLLARLEAILSTGDLEAQRSIFRDAEDLAQASKLHDIVESWGPDAAFLRG